MQALRQIAAMRPDIVILGSVQTANFTQTQWIVGTTRLLKAISAASGHIYVLRSTPHLPFNGPSCLSSQNWLPWLHFRQVQCRAPAFDKHANDVYRWLQQASGRFDNVTALDMNSAVCPEGECVAELNGIVVFRDSQHMTATFVESLSSYLAKQLNLEQSPSPPRHAN
jgi:hypothetical protein